MMAREKLPWAPPLVELSVGEPFSDPFKINIFNELVFYVANMSMTRRCGRPSC